MMQLASATMRPFSTITGKRATGHIVVSSRQASQSGDSSSFHSNGVPFSYSAVKTFCEYDENGWAYSCNMEAPGKRGGCPFIFPDEPGCGESTSRHAQTGGEERVLPPVPPHPSSSTASGGSQRVMSYCADAALE